MHPPTPPPDTGAPCSRPSHSWRRAVLLSGAQKSECSLHKAFFSPWPYIKVEPQSRIPPGGDSDFQGRNFAALEVRSKMRPVWDTDLLPVEGFSCPSPRLLQEPLGGVACKSPFVFLFFLVWGLSWHVGFAIHVSAPWCNADFGPSQSRFLPHVKRLRFGRLRASHRRSRQNFDYFGLGSAARSARISGLE